MRVSPAPDTLHTCGCNLRRTGRKKSTFSNVTSATCKQLNEYQYLDWDGMHSQKYAGN